MSIDRSRWQKSWPKRLCDIPRAGLRVETRREMRNTQVTVPAGYRGFVTTSRNGWHLLYFNGDECGTCHVKPAFSRCSPTDFWLLDIDGERQP